MDRNLIHPQIDGPLQVEGEIEIFAADGTLIQKTSEARLCRCGKSSHKPFCDGSHRTDGFRDPVRVSRDYRPKAVEPGAAGPALRVSVRSNGPLRAQGEMEVCEADGRVAWSGAQASFCRCGASKNKPFCDGSHREIGFQG